MSRGLDRRLEALREAVEAARGRLDDRAVARAEEVVARAGQRIGLGLEATVVALAGPTGAGKSTLFNALAGQDLVTAGRRRPTTSVSTAAVWGEVPDALLDWLEVPRRHRVPASANVARSALRPVAPDGRRSATAGSGLVLLDLPDFDSIEQANRDEVERVIALADLLVWVVDPQKYADGAWHERYLRPLAGHAAVMEVVLNQADLLDPRAVAATRDDLRRLLREDGLGDVPVHPASAVTGLGLEELRRAVERRVAARSAAVERLAADVGGAAATLGETCGGRAGRLGRAERDRLVGALGQAAGVPAVTDAVERAHRRRGALATGWPAVRWVRRLRPDPLRRLRLADRGGASPRGGGDPVRPSLPAPTALQRAGVSTATRALAAAAAEALDEPWPRLVREAATRDEDRAADELGARMGEVDLRVTSPRWWRAVGALQWLLVAIAVVGAVWLLGLAALGWLRIEDDLIPTPEVRGIALPTLLLLGGALAGLLVAVLARFANRVGARRRARRARRALEARVAEVADERIVAPVRAELEAREALCRAVGTARR